MKHEIVIMHLLTRTLQISMNFHLNKCPLVMFWFVQVEYNNNVQGRYEQKMRIHLFFPFSAVL